MSSVATKLMTAEDFYDFVNEPRNRHRHFELEAGEVVKASRPGEKHGLTCTNGIYRLSSYIRQREKGYVLSNDGGLVLEHDPDTVRGPDI